MKYKVMSRAGCERYCSQKHKDDSIIISIKSSWDNIEPNVYSTRENGVVDILSLSFDDIELEDAIKYDCMDSLISEIDAKKIVGFVDKYYRIIDTIIVHCDGGISRSTGVISAISWWLDDDSHYFYARSKYPNITCFLRVLKEFENDKSRFRIPTSKGEYL